MAKSLAAQAGALSTTELKLPAIFSAPQPQVVARSIAPYITFAHPKRSDEWAKLVARMGKVEEGDMYLIRQEGCYHLAPLKCGWLCHKQYWAEVNAVGEVLRVSWKEMPRPYKEHIEAVVLVYHGNERIIPANIQFRSTKCPAAKTMADTLLEASTAKWGEKSPEHAETMVCNQPFMRFFGEIALGPSRTSKSTGMPYRTTLCSVKPTGVPEWRLLKAFCDDADATKVMEEAALRFQSRCDELNAKLVK